MNGLQGVVALVPAFGDAKKWAGLGSEEILPSLLALIWRYKPDGFPSNSSATYGWRNHGRERRKHLFPQRT
jgi:hypothetical protein